MRLNTIAPAPGAKKERVRVGRGIGCGLGKTCGKGHKGQHARAGGYHKRGFEGGQMPIQRRLPKYGFTSLTRDSKVELPLSALNKIKGAEINLDLLIEKGFVAHDVLKVKVILSGKIEHAVTVSGIAVTKGARSAIEAAGGKVVD